MKYIMYKKKNEIYTIIIIAQNIENKIIYRD